MTQELSSKIVEIAHARRRLGYRRIHDMLRPHFPGVNHKRVYRLYSAANLAVRKRKKAKRTARERVPLQLATTVNEVWSMDFVSDSLSTGRRIKCLTVADDFSHECVSIAVDSGIGRAAALALAQTGHVVVLSGRRADALQAVAREVAAQGGTARSFVLDVTDSEAVVATAAAVERSVGPIDVLVNSAGINVTAPSWVEVGVAAWRQIVDVNLTGTFQCMYAVLPSLRTRGDGLVINVASWTGRHAL